MKKNSVNLPDSEAMTSVLVSVSESTLLDDAGKINCPKLIPNRRHHIEIHFKSFTLISSGNVRTISSWEPSNKPSSFGAFFLSDLS